MNPEKLSICYQFGSWECWSSFNVFSQLRFFNKGCGSPALFVTGEKDSPALCLLIPKTSLGHSYPIEICSERNVFRSIHLPAQLRKNELHMWMTGIKFQPETRISHLLFSRAVPNTGVSLFVSLSVMAACTMLYPVQSEHKVYRSLKFP